MGEAAQLLFKLIENRAYFLKALLQAGTKVASHTRHGKVRSKQELPSLVMHEVGDALDLLFQRFI
jgi:hypothetical protein